MKLGIVGSRKRASTIDKNLILNKVKELRPDYIISGGCPVGADRFAEEIAVELGIPTIIHKPDLTDVEGYGDSVQRYYARNKLIADESDMLIALLSPDGKKGGTDNTVSYFKANGKSDKLILL